MRKRAVPWAIVLCVALAVPVLVQTSFARQFENATVNVPTSTSFYRHLDRAGASGPGPVEIPEPPALPCTGVRAANANAKAGGEPGAFGGISPRAGGMTRVQKAEVEIRSLIRKLG